MIEIKRLSKEDIISFLIVHGEKKSRATHIFDSLWKKGVSSFEEMTTIPIETRNLLKEHFELHNLTINLEKESSDKTLKIAFRLIDGCVIEGVIIPSLERTTACISSQVGCALACSFCATGKMGFIRNLSYIEIYDQVMLLNRISNEKFGHPLNNIVMMGMGEPLLNYENVMKSIDCLTSNWGLAMSHNRITVSTAGISENIKQLADDGFNGNLAISLHSADNDIRSKLMKVNKTNNLTDLSDAILYYYKKTRKKVTFEYLLLQGINDSLDDAKKLVRFCNVFPSKINIITYNNNEQTSYQRTTDKQRQDFVAYLVSQKMIVTLRASKGQDIDAACGQLAGKQISKRINT